MTHTASTLGLVFLCLLPVGCAGLEKPTIAVQPTARAAAHLYVTRPFKAIPQLDPFIQGVATAFAEQFVLSGYDFTGTTLDPGGQEALREHLLDKNKVVPCTVGVHLEFDEAPIIVGFGTAYTEIRCVVYDPNGQILLIGELDPPERRSLLDLLLPPRFPDVEGRAWGQRTWRQNLSFFFPPRG